MADTASASVGSSDAAETSPKVVAPNVVDEPPSNTPATPAMPKARTHATSAPANDTRSVFAMRFPLRDLASSLPPSGPACIGSLGAPYAPRELAAGACPAS